MRPHTATLVVSVSTYWTWVKSKKHARPACWVAARENGKFFIVSDGAESHDWWCKHLGTPAGGLSLPMAYGWMVEVEELLEAVDANPSWFWVWGGHV
jgi:hypothetical protein